MGENPIFDGLNDAQREAVEAVTGPVAILAGAGTGKTTTITRRIANQVLTGTFMPGEILAVTFTAKAAGEMRSRLQALGATGMRANTFHAEALAQFRRFSPEQPEILAHKGQVLHRIVQSLPMPYRFTALRDLAGEIEWAKNRRIPARDYLERIGSHEPPIPTDLMHRVYVTYEKRKRTAAMIDFEDLLEQTVTLLQDDERALGVVRGRYRAFTVDEYQDVNMLQQTLLDLWIGARDDVCVVGDDYQSIFGFTGATPEHLLRFADRWDHTTIVTLEENYRSTPEILTVANRLVPRLRGSKKSLRATKPEGTRPELRDFESGRQEIAWIVSECRRLHTEGTAYEDMAVLFRINGRSEDFEEAFARAHIPFQVRDGSFLQRPAARSFVVRARAASGPVAIAAVRVVTELGYDPRGKYDGGDEATRQADLERLVALAAEFPAKDSQSGME
ncbi:MAG TPA: ATP-dependent helicase, partial [Actinomycetota bacterium]|nr:ATP-dependent helicase [Actinomycetota bacterium]